MSWVWHRGCKGSNTGSRQPDWNTPAPPPQEAYVEALYAWERHCRGYDLHPGPVRLEPPFTPFAPDRRPVSKDVESYFLPAHPIPRAFVPLGLPAGQKVTLAAVESFLASLRGVGNPLAFEIVADAREITFQLSAQANEFEELAANWTAHFSTSRGEIEGAGEVEDVLLSKMDGLTECSVGYAVVDFGLWQFAYLPLRLATSFAPDPLMPIVTTLGQLQAGEVAGLQILFTPTRRPWAESLYGIAAEFDEGERLGHPRSPYSYPQTNGPLAQAGRKIASPLWAVAVRVFAVSVHGHERAFELCRKVGIGLEPCAEPEGNALLALDDAGYPAHEHVGDLLARQSRRCGMLLSTRELIGLVHPPSEHLQHSKLLRLDTTEEPLPADLRDAPGALLGLHPYREQAEPVPWPDAYRNRHLYMLGATRMGKSTLLLNLIAQDLNEGRGLCLIDPHGDLALDALRLVPSDRAEDVVYIDFGDREHPLAMGLLDASDEWERRLLCSDVLSVLRRLFAASWGDRLEHILRHALLTLLSQPGHTLRDIRPLLSDKEYREGVLRGVTDPELRAFWSGEFPGYPSSAFAPLYNKLGLLLSSPLVRNVVAARESRLPLSRCMDEGRVLIVNLNRGVLGEDAAHFLGALLVSKLQIAAMGRLRHSRERRTPFTLYVDEFQHLVVGSFETILSEAGKAGLHLVLANQFLEQLGERLQTAILSNAGTLVSFRVSAESGRRLEREFAGRFTSDDVVRLNRGEALCRIGSAEYSLRLKTLPPPQSEDEADNLAEEIVARTRLLCCRPRAEVEAELAAEAATNKTTAEDENKGSKESKPAKPVTPAAKAGRQKKARASKASKSKPPNAVIAADSNPVDEVDDDGVDGVDEVDDEGTDLLEPPLPTEPTTFGWTEPEAFGVPDTDDGAGS